MYIPFLGHIAALLHMSAMNRNSKKSSKSNFIYIGIGIVVVAAALFAYLMWYVAPAENMEMVKIIAVTEQGCIGETFDGFAVNIGDCQAQPGDVINALVDQKTKERAAAMNPTS